MLTVTLDEIEKCSTDTKGMCELIETLDCDYGIDDIVPLPVLLEIIGTVETLLLMQRTKRDEFRPLIALFMFAVAEHVLPFFEELYQNDDRPRRDFELAKSAFERTVLETFSGGTCEVSTIIIITNALNSCIKPANEVFKAVASVEAIEKEEQRLIKVLSLLLYKGNNKQSWRSKMKNEETAYDALTLEKSLKGVATATKGVTEVSMDMAEASAKSAAAASKMTKKQPIPIIDLASEEEGITMVYHTDKVAAAITRHLSGDDASKPFRTTVSQACGTRNVYYFRTIDEEDTAFKNILDKLGEHDGNGPVILPISFMSTRIYCKGNLISIENDANEFKIIIIGVGNISTAYTYKTKEELDSVLRDRQAWVASDYAPRLTSPGRGSAEYNRAIEIIKTNFANIVGKILITVCIGNKMQITEFTAEEVESMKEK